MYKIAAREKDGRAYRYRATVSRDEYTGDLMGEALAANPKAVADYLGGKDHAGGLAAFAAICFGQ